MRFEILKVEILDNERIKVYYIDKNGYQKYVVVNRYYIEKISYDNYVYYKTRNK